MAEPLEPGDPARVGKYRLLGRLGEGGMGQVFLGSTVGGRLVAVKLITSRYAADDEFRARFAREVAAARLVGGFHTAQVVDADTDAAEPWMASAYIAGPSLWQAVVVGGGPMCTDAVCALGAALAEGLAAIHSCGLVHRDLKPGNIILADDGPRIIDFGIVRAMGSRSVLTARGGPLGTVPFMSPEQVSGEPVGPASDVFSLGSVLAFAATGRGPFDAAEQLASMYRVRFELPALDTVSDPLRALLAHCLAKDPGNRPALDDLLHSLAEFAGALPAHAATHPADTQQASTHPANAHAASTEPASEGRESRPDRPAAPPSLVLKQVPAAAAAVTVVPRPGTPTVPPQRQSQGRPGPSEPSALPFPATRRGAGNEDATNREAAPEAGARLDLQSAGGEVRRVAFSPDGTLLAGVARFAEPHAPDRIYLWHVATGRLAGAPDDGTTADNPAAASLSRAELDFDARDSDLRFSPDSRFLACGPFAGRALGAEIWDLPARSPVSLEHGELARWLTACALSPDGRFFAGIGPGRHSCRGAPGDCTAFLWELSTGRLVDRPARLSRRMDGATWIAFAPDGRLLFGHRARGVLARETGPGAPVRPYPRKRPPGAAGTKPLLSPDGRWLATCGTARPGTGRRGQQLNLWDLTRHAAAGHLDLTGLDAPLAFSPDGTVLAAHGSGERNLVFLDTVSGRRVPPVRPIEADIWLREVLLSPAGRLIATHQRTPGSADGQTRNHAWEFQLLDAATGQPTAGCLRFTGTHQQAGPSMLFAPGGRHFVVRAPEDAALDDGAGGIYWWPLAGDSSPAPRQLPTGATSSATFSPDGRLLATAADGTAQLWHLG